jgi:hypothetical protein
VGRRDDLGPFGSLEANVPSVRVAPRKARGGRLALFAPRWRKFSRLAATPSGAGDAVEVPAAPKAHAVACPRERRSRGTERARRDLSICDAKRSHARGIVTARPKPGAGGVRCA